MSFRVDGSQVQRSDHPSFGAPTGDVRISADGRFVAYDTWASLAPGDSTATGDWQLWVDTYVFDRVTRTTQPVSVGTNGQFIHGGNPEISANGRYVMFHLKENLYVRDRQNGTTTLVYGHVMGNTVMSANGQYAMTPSPGVHCFDQELVLIDFVDGSTERIDVTDDGEGAVQEDGMAYIMYDPAISDDGRYVAFKSHSWNLVPGLSQPRPSRAPSTTTSSTSTCGTARRSRPGCSCWDRTGRCRRRPSTTRWLAATAAWSV